MHHVALIVMIEVDEMGALIRESEQSIMKNGACGKQGWIITMNVIGLDDISFYTPAILKFDAREMHRHAAF